MGIIYKITNTINQKVYIGQTVRSFTERKSEHLLEARKESRFKIHRAIRKYGENKFLWEIIFEDKDITTKELDEKEKYFIKLYKSNIDEFGYNMTEGGDSLGSKFGEENPFFNKHHTKETIEAISKHFVENKTFYRENNPAWNGGRFKHKKDGIIYIRDRDHPSSNKNGYICEHRLIMEKHIGRYLEKDEIVIHTNGIKDDNRIENLELISRSEFHRRIRLGKKCLLSNKGLENIRKANSGKTVSIETRKKQSAARLYTTDLLDTKFGSLTVIAFSRIDTKGISYWLCKCDCGEEVEKARYELLARVNPICSKHCLILQHKKIEKSKIKEEDRLRKQQLKEKKRIEKESIKKDKKTRTVVYKTHCRKGHPLSGDNLILERNKHITARRCKLCRDEKNKRNHEKYKQQRQLLHAQEQLITNEGNKYEKEAC